MNRKKKQVICIIGPTASGKSKLAIELAKKINAEIISADSMQIYKGLDIGSAKVTDEEQDGIPHHLIDFLELDEKFSVAEYKDMCYETINQIFARGKNVILVGGTGLYISAVINNMQFNTEVIDEEYRKNLYDLAKKYSNEYIHNILKSIDKESAAKIPVSNLKRVIRAIEMYKFTGKTKNEHMEEELARIEQEKSIKSLPYEFKIYGIEIPREILYERINNRVHKMMLSGLLSEAKKIYNLKLKKDCTCMQAIGYKEFFDFFEGNKTLDESIITLQQETRRYAKRQITWFKRIDNVKWIDGIKDTENQLSQVLGDGYEKKRR